MIVAGKAAAALGVAALNAALAWWVWRKIRPDVLGVIVALVVVALVLVDKDLYGISIPAPFDEKERDDG